MKTYRVKVKQVYIETMFVEAESEVIKNEFLIKLEHTTDEQFYNKFVKQNKGILL